MNEKQEAKSRISYLQERLKLWSKNYHQLNISEVSDQVYDAHYQELFELEKKFPEFIRADSETGKVGSEIAQDQKLKKISHLVPMLSLENIFDQEELDRWLKRARTQLELETEFPEISCEYKIDGLSISILYQDGLVQKAITRGNGLVGEDVTENIKTIVSLPKEINFKEKLEVRGEVFMPFSVFKDFPQFANPRNAASGSLKLLDSRICAQRKLDLFIFEALVQKFKSHSENLEFLQELGFPINPENYLAKNLEEIKTCYLDFEKKREKLNYGVDGMVLKLDQLSFRNKLGENNKYPRWAAAYKFSSEKAESQITQIESEVGRSGAITPVASILPVKLAGSTVKRASLHNFDFIRRLDIRVGDFVLVHKAGDIIPEVLSVNQTKRTLDTQEFKAPETCPSCQSKLVKENPKEVAIKCINPECPAQIERKIEYWCSKSALDIRGLGKSIIKLLLSENLIKTIPDLYKLKDQRKELLSLEGFQEKSVENLLEALEKSKKVELFRFLTALGIKYLGGTLAKLLSQNFKDLATLQKASREELEQIEGIGPNIAEEVANYFRETRSLNLIQELISLGFQFTNTQFSEGSKELSARKIFVITGSFENQTREQIKDAIEQSGHKVVNSISKKTDYLICGEKAGSKLKKAQELGVKIIQDLGELDQVLETS